MMESEGCQQDPVDSSDVLEILTGINDLPDEILENIFTRLSPYDDLDNIKLVCRRWNKVARDIVYVLKSNFHQAVRCGTLECVKQSATYNENGRIVGYWISQRFGQMCSSHNKKIYIMGGTTHTPTTFNDMWSFDLTTRLWCRLIPKGGTYPSPKALGTFVRYKDNLVLFGGWAHPSPYPFMQPWRIFDELHMYNVEENRWGLEETVHGPPPTAGHSATVHGDSMVVFGGRTFDQGLQSYPLSKTVWIFDFINHEWHKLETLEGNGPSPRYGHTQVVIDDSHLLIIGGCGGPNQIFSDVWLLSINENYTGNGKHKGVWREMVVVDGKKSIPVDFHYAGVKIDDTVIFFERSSPISPFLAFLHFGSQNPQPPEQDGVVFESDRSGFHSRCSSIKAPLANGTMPIYSLDISKVLIDGTVNWAREPVDPDKFPRPNERLLYSMVAGRGEIILFGGFYKEPNGRRCRVSSDLFFLGTRHKSY